MNGRATRNLRREPFRTQWCGHALVAILLWTASAAAQTPAASPPSGPATPSVAGIRDAVTTIYQDTGVPPAVARSLQQRQDAIMASQAPAPAPVAQPAPAPAAAEAAMRTVQLVTPKTDEAIGRSGCSTCGGYHSQSDSLAFHGAIGGCSDGQCIPGRDKCDALVPACDNFISAFASNLYQSLCCPDPCYQPRWEPVANASLFADFAKPRTVTRIRYDLLQNMTFPDRNQYFMQQTPKLYKSNAKKLRSAPSTRMQVLYLYQEAATAAGSFFIEYPYLQLNPIVSPTTAGFGDIRLGTKSVLYDVEMLRVTFQFKTYLPSGNGGKGFGTGHTSLEPSILTSLKLGPETYFQGQFGQWIPLGGDQKLTGGIFFSYMSLNQVLMYVTPSSPLIAMLEMDGWAFESGGYTNPLKSGKSPIHSGGGVPYFNIGPGLRLSICDKIDVGGTITWATTKNHWADPWFRFEVRFLF